jgi:hypothetical protein
MHEARRGALMATTRPTPADLPPVIEAVRFRGGCRRWPDKWAYPTADSASLALRSVARAQAWDGSLVAYECEDASDTTHWHLGRLASPTPPERRARGAGGD